MSKRLRQLCSQPSRISCLRSCSPLPALDAPLQNKRLQRRHTEMTSDSADVALTNLLGEDRCCPLVEAARDAAFEGTLQRHISELQLAGAVRRDIDEMNARVLALHPAAAAFCALVHWPRVNEQQNVSVRAELIVDDHALGMREQHVSDPALHRLLCAPMIDAVGDVDARSERGGSSIRKRSSSLPLEDALQRKQIAAERSSNAHCDLPLVLRSDDSHIDAAHCFVRPRCSRH